ncbi:MAG: Lipopolysaccharide heptosyltransferase [Pseudomonadota bacterium]|jgi:heptosyltransferase-1
MLKILIVRVSSLGDVLHNMPMLQDILQHHPDAQIDWVVEEAYVNLVRLPAGVNTIIPVALRRWRKSLLSAATRAEIAAFRRNLKTTAYDFVFDTQGLFKTGLLMSWARLAPGGQKIGLANGTEGSGYEAISRVFHSRSIAVPSRTHAVARARLVAAAGLGYQVQTPADFGLRHVQFSAAPAWLPQKPFAVFFHATARAAKKWPQSAWVETGHFLVQRGWLILLPWGNEEEQTQAQSLAQQIPGARVLPALPMHEAVQLAQAASLVIGVDTGLTHIAAAFERPTIELYCDSPRWKTEGNWSERIINLGDSGQAPAVLEVKAALVKLGIVPRVS